MSVRDGAGEVTLAWAVGVTWMEAALDGLEAVGDVVERPDGVLPGVVTGGGTGVATQPMTKRPRMIAVVAMAALSPR